MKNDIKYLVYLRKSTDSEDRQIQSIEDQRKELRRIADQLHVDIVGYYQENMSAKRPGRPEFNRMLSDIRKGKATGILCWKLNRLARNPVDGGEIMWLVQEGIIQSVQTPGREYKTGDNVIIMSVELGMASQYVLDLSRDVKRGMQSKAEKGWRPGRAPLGYLNDKGGEQGNKIIHVDEEKFPLVRKLWDLMLTGEYSVPKLTDIANDDWGLKRSTSKGDKRLHESYIHKLLTNPFYYGEYTWNGITHQGKHRPMISQDEFDRVQSLLGLKAKPQTRHRFLPYRGILRCGECGCYITTEKKTKLIKSEGKLRSYIYHHCTHRKAEANCRQMPVSHEEINSQILEILKNISIPESFLSFALDILRRDNEIQTENRATMEKNHRKTLASCNQRIDNLIKAYISQVNQDRDLISDQEFKDQKSSLIKEKTAVQTRIESLERQAEEWFNLTEQSFRFATHARHQFETGDFETKTRILMALGQNFVLKDGKVTIQLKKPYQIIEEGRKRIQAENPGLELDSLALDETKTASFEAISATLSG